MSIVHAKQKMAKLVDSHTTLHLALSGGADSVALFLMAKDALKDGQTLITHHVKHNVSKNTEAWAEFVRNLVEKESFSSKGCIKHIEHSVFFKNTSNFESEARSKRYDAILSCVHEDEALLVGHHADDQVENVLINVLKGRGIKGITSLRESSKMAHKTIYRPLLNTSKRDVIKYVVEAGNDYIHDESNDCSDYDRNFIRNNVVPLFLKRFPKVKNAIMATYESLLSTDMALSELVEMQIEKMSVSGKDNALTLTSFNTMSENVKRLIVMTQLRNMGFYKYGKKTLIEVCRQAISVEENGRMNGCIVFKNKHDEIHVTFEKHDGKKVMVFTFKS